MAREPQTASSMKLRSLVVALAGLACAVAQAAPPGATGAPPSQPAPTAQGQNPPGEAPQGQPTQPGSQAQPGAAAQSGAPTTATRDMTGARERHMEKCPSAMPGTKTTVTNTKNGVDLKITTNDAATQTRLEQLARFHSVMVIENPFAPRHSGMRGSSGAIGYCPIVHQDTVLSYTRVPNGVVIHVVTPPGNVAHLQAQTASRLQAIQQPSS